MDPNGKVPIEEEFFFSNPRSLNYVPVLLLLYYSLNLFLADYNYKGLLDSPLNPWLCHFFKTTYTMEFGIYNFIKTWQNMHSLNTHCFLSISFAIHQPFLIAENELFVKTKITFGVHCLTFLF